MKPRYILGAALAVPLSAIVAVLFAPLLLLAAVAVGLYTLVEDVAKGR